MDALHCLVDDVERQPGVLENAVEEVFQLGAVEVGQLTAKETLSDRFPRKLTFAVEHYCTQYEHCFLQFCTCWFRLGAGR